MKIGEDYKVESDSLNVTVYQREVAKKSGKERWSPIGYFSNVHNALDFLTDYLVNKTGLKDLKTVVKKQDEILGLIKGLTLHHNNDIIEL